LIFQTSRDVENFFATCDDLVPEARLNAATGTIAYRDRATRVWANPVSVDPSGLQCSVRSEEALRIGRHLETELGEKTIVRVDRLDPTKNVDGGFAAFERLLERHPEWTGRVRFLAFLQSSRTDVEEYRNYGEQVIEQVDRINERFRNG